MGEGREQKRVVVFRWIWTTDDKERKDIFLQMLNFRSIVDQHCNTKPCIRVLVSVKLSTIHRENKKHVIVTNITRFDVFKVL